ncbi:hypothetical protein K2173_009903 [Erythroxylum novogranatense]|uniref:PQ-loop repeat family protein / transmembrane family protein n=1 Tax=Erythroxylum novogranatense TaxID=1862640 RepID=A0AAV8SZ99_9ROSI|nr:hypothetical protein K2173_009903 [Erythroxylum novogranatense]
MVAFGSAKRQCPSSRNCSEWARVYMEYCLCSFRDGVSLSLGLVSVCSWGIAEIPQIITNYKKKSAHGLSIAFLATWIIGDLFNVFGCMLEPATLPTQYYMAMLYTLTTLILSGQTVYYGYIYHRLSRSRKNYKTEVAEKGRRVNNDAAVKQFNQADKQKHGSNTVRENVLSSPIPLPAVHHHCSPGRELYYMSARSLSSSHTPTAGSLSAQRMSPRSFPKRNSVEEPLLDPVVSAQSEPNMSIRTTLCVVSAFSFLGTFNLNQAENKRPDKVFGGTTQGFVIQVGRKILQVSGGLSSKNNIETSNGPGTFFGWAMAAIYMGGRLPQICLNIRRGNVEGLNPFMFVFALVGNATYVASILVNSLEWSKIRPNLPWLVDAGGCVLLDSFILLQFIYFRYWSPKAEDEDQQKISIVC